MAQLNLAAGWVGVLLGFAAGAIPGLFFHDPDWLGGYSSWRRRMIRLAHISFFGIGLLNLAFALTARQIDARSDAAMTWSSWLLVFGAFSMPTICYLSAYRDRFRHLFVLPVLSLIVGVGLFAFLEVMR
jgi:hypothetical protein